MATPRLRPRVNGRALTASAAQLGEPDGAYAQRQAMPWQPRTLEYIDIVPELNYASRFYSRMLKQLQLYPVLIGDDGVPLPNTDQVAVAALRRIQDPGGGRTQILGNYGRLMFATGEGLLFGRDLETDDEQWLFVWTSELQVETNSDGSVRKITWKPNGEKDAKVYGPDEAVVYRMWTQHPRSTGEADSPMRSCLRIAEELVALEAAVLSQAVSRTTQGILFMPSNLAPPPAQVDGDEDPLSDPFMGDFVEHLVAQKENAGTAAAVAPYVVWGDPELIAAVRLVPLHSSENDYAERDLRKEAVERLARGMDFPPEVMLGFGESNHWAARQIMDDMWRSHGVSLAEQFCDDLNQVYYRPALRNQGYENWARVAIGYDESQVVVKPDRSADADLAIGTLAIGFDGYRKMKGIEDSMAPTDEEIRLILALKGRGPKLGEEDDEGVDTERDASEGPPDPGPEGDSGRKTRETAAMEMGAAMSAVHRCRELAGSRIRMRAKKLGGDVVPDNGPVGQVAFSVGSEILAGLKLEPRELVRDGSSVMRPVLTQLGYTAKEMSTLCEMVELFAARTLFNEMVDSPPAIEAHILRVKDVNTKADQMIRQEVGA